MTLRTTEMAVIRHPSGELRLEIDWDDAAATIDPDSGEKHPDTGELLEFRAINTTTLTGWLILRRGGAQTWRDVPIPPGTHLYPPGGPVKELTDVSGWSIGLGR